MRRSVYLAATYALASVALLAFLFPLLWLVATSLKPPIDTFAIPPRLLFRPTLENYRHLFGPSLYGMSIDFLHNFRNSLVVATLSTLTTLSVAAVSAYALSRFTFAGKRGLGLGILLTRMLPPIGTVIPLFLLANRLGLVDTHAALIIAYTALDLPLAVWMLRGFMDQIPVELDEAARVDGCSAARILIQIVGPLAAPGLAATAVFSFVLAWNDFALAVVLTASVADTLPMLVQSFITDEGVLWGPISAATVLILLPPIALSILTQRYIAQGLTLGAVKG